MLSVLPKLAIGSSALWTHPDGDRLLRVSLHEGTMTVEQLQEGAAAPCGQPLATNRWCDQQYEFSRVVHDNKLFVGGGRDRKYKCLPSCCWLLGLPSVLQLCCAASTEFTAYKPSAMSL